MAGNEERSRIALEKIAENFNRLNRHFATFLQTQPATARQLAEIVEQLKISNEPFDLDETDEAIQKVREMTDAVSDLGYATAEIVEIRQEIQEKGPKFVVGLPVKVIGTDLSREGWDGIVSEVGSTMINVTFEDGGRSTFLPHQLAVIGEEEEPKKTPGAFKVGNRVRVTNHSSPLYFWVGTVVEVRKGHADVNFDAKYKNRNVWAMALHELGMIPDIGIGRHGAPDHICGELCIQLDRLKNIRWDRPAGNPKQEMQDSGPLTHFTIEKDGTLTDNRQPVEENPNAGVFGAERKDFWNPCGAVGICNHRTYDECKQESERSESSPFLAGDLVRVVDPNIPEYTWESTVVSVTSDGACELQFPNYNRSWWLASSQLARVQTEHTMLGIHPGTGNAVPMPVNPRRKPIDLSYIPPVLTAEEFAERKLFCSNIAMPGWVMGALVQVIDPADSNYGRRAVVRHIDAQIIGVVFGMHSGEYQQYQLALISNSTEEERQAGYFFTEEDRLQHGLALRKRALEAVEAKTGVTPPGLQKDRHKAAWAIHSGATKHYNMMDCEAAGCPGPQFETVVLDWEKAAWDLRLNDRVLVVAKGHDLFGQEGHVSNLTRKERKVTSIKVTMEDGAKRVFAAGEVEKIGLQPHTVGDCEIVGCGECPSAAEMDPNLHDTNDDSRD